MLADIDKLPCAPRSRPISDEKLKSPPAAAAAPESTLAAICSKREITFTTSARKQSGFENGVENDGIIKPNRCQTLMSMGVEESFMKAGVDLDRP